MSRFAMEKFFGKGKISMAGRPEVFLVVSESAFGSGAVETGLASDLFSADWQANQMSKPERSKIR